MNTEDTKSAKKKFPIKRVILTILGIIVAGAIGTGIYFGFTYKAKQTTDSAAALYLDPQTQPIPITATNSGVPQSSETSTSSGQVAGVSTSQPQSPAAQPTNKIYTYASMNFSIALPDAWKTSRLSNEVIITTPDNQRYSVQMYSIPGSDSQSLKAFLISQPNLHAITPANIVGNEGFAFSIDGIYRHGYAFLNNGRLYYLLGSGIENSPIAQTFKIL